MACCALKKEKKQLMVTSIVLLAILLCIGSIILLLLTILGFLSKNILEKRNNFYKLFKNLIKGLKDKILYKPFIVGCATKSKLTGKIMKISSPMAGMVFKYFNLILLIFIAGSIYLCTLGYHKLVG
jgi:hypothetical protein